MENGTDKKTYFFDRPGSVRLVVRVLVAICALLVALDFFYHRHVMHPWEAVWAFYAIYGFVACVILVLVAKEMRKVVMRDEDYYDRDLDD